MDKKELTSLRKMLDDLTGKNDLLQTQYTNGIEQLRNIFGHRIEVLPTENQDSYTCFAFALGFSSISEYVEAVKIRFADSIFFRHLIKQHKLSPPEHEKPDCIVTYSNDGCLQHAGAITANTDVVVSKWGRNKLHRHPLFEIPASYGWEVVYYATPDPEEAFQWYREWLELD